MHASYIFAAALALPAAAAFTAPAAAGLRPSSAATSACSSARAPSLLAARAVAPAGPRRSAVLGLRASADTKTVESIKGDLMSILSVGTGLKQAADPRNAAEVNELLLKLEPQNPTHAPAESELLNGAWELLYTGPYAQVHTHLTPPPHHRSGLQTPFATSFLFERWVGRGSLVERSGWVQGHRAGGTASGAGCSDGADHALHLCCPGSVPTQSVGSSSPRTP